MDTMPLSWYQNRLAQRLREEGREELREAIVGSILRLLSQRGVPVPEAASERIHACHDAQQLTRWIERAATARTVDDLFGED